MTGTVWSRLIAVAVVLGSLGCGSRSSGSDVWAEVNGQPILKQEVEKLFTRQVRSLPEPLSPEEALTHKLSILNELIQNQILLQKAAQAGLLATESDVEARFQRVRAPFSDEELGRQLEMEGMTLADLREDLHKEVSINKLLDQEVGKHVQVSEPEVNEYYEKHKDRFYFVEAQYRVGYILVTPRRERDVRNLRNDDAATRSDAQRKIQLLTQRLRAGDDFGELARNFSEDPDSAMAGGDIGFFSESAFADAPQVLARTVQRMRAGEWRGPVETSDGFYLVKLLEHEPPGQRQLEEVREDIRKRLERSKRQVLEAAFIEQARNEAGVVNYLARQILESGGVP